MVVYMQIESHKQWYSHRMHEVTPSTDHSQGHHSMGGPTTRSAASSPCWQAGSDRRQGKECPQGLPTCQTLQCKRDLPRSTHFVLFVGGNRKNVLSTSNGD